MSYTYKDNTDYVLQMDIKFTDNSKEVLYGFKRVDEKQVGGEQKCWS